MSQLQRPARSDRRRVMITPEGITLPVTLASRGTRFGALVLDLSIMTFFSIVVVVVLGFATGGQIAQSDKLPGSSRQAGEFLMILIIAAMFLTRYGYFLVFELGPRGATPGKRMTGVRIAARDGGRLRAEMVLARNLLRDIEVFLPVQLLIAGSVSAVGDDNGMLVWGATVWFMLFALFPFFNHDRLRAGDLIAGTWVIEAPKRKLEAVMSTTHTATGGASQTTGTTYRFGEAELAVYGEYELQTLERVLREGRGEAMAAVHEAICRKINWTPGAGDERAFLEAYYTQLRARLESGMRLGKRKADKHG